MELDQKKEALINRLISRGILKSREVIDAFRKVPREGFVLQEYRKHAYENVPLPIMEEQTISQPLTVAAMTEALDVKKGMKVLEVGAGSGYQAAIIAEIVGKDGIVATTERIKSVFEFAKSNLSRYGYKNVIVVHTDGSKGYGKYAPYDRIIVTASSPGIPNPLIKMTKIGGKIVIPVGDEMILAEKTKNKITKIFLGYYSFVPLIGEYGYSE